jgi:hypothetical protein
VRSTLTEESIGGCRHPAAADASRAMAQRAARDEPEQRLGTHGHPVPNRAGIGRNLRLSEFAAADV